MWVLRRVYGFAPADAATAIRALLAAANVEMNRPAVGAGLSVLDAGANSLMVLSPLGRQPPDAFSASRASKRGMLILSELDYR